MAPFLAAVAATETDGPKNSFTAIFYCFAIKQLILMAAFLAAVAATETDGQKNSLTAIFYHFARTFYFKARVGE